MSDQSKAPRSGSNGQTDVARALNAKRGVCKNGDDAPCIGVPQPAEWALDISLSAAVGVSTSVRPGRSRNRTKTELEEKVKKPADDVRKKSPPARKTPARGRYVDEYARPAL